MSKSSIEAIEKEIESILTEAEKRKLKIIDDARKRAKEILSRPIPVDTYKLEAEKIIKEAEEKAETILEEAKRRSEEIKNIDKNKFEEAVNKTVTLVAGVE